MTIVPFKVPYSEIDKFNWDDMERCYVFKVNQNIRVYATYNHKYDLSFDGYNGWYEVRLYSQKDRYYHYGKYNVLENAFIKAINLNISHMGGKI